MLKLILLIHIKKYVLLYLFNISKLLKILLSSISIVIKSSSHTYIVNIIIKKTIIDIVIMKYVNRCEIWYPK
jgi:hypothetical protein